MKKTFFLIPGFRTQISADMYTWLVNFLIEENYEVIPVPVSWSRKTITQNTADFVDFFNGHKTEKNIVLGFSYGAVIAFLASDQIKIDKLYLCSLSPDFCEDSDFMPLVIQKYIGKKRFKDTKARCGRTLAKHLKTPTTIFYGEHEGNEFPQLKKRAKETAQFALQAKLIAVPNSPHQIDYPEYVRAIKSELQIQI